MDTKALLRKALDLAVRGKLVKERDGGKPAAEIVEQIRDKRHRMLAEGTLRMKNIKVNTVIFRGGDDLYYETKDGKIRCIDGEIPFELPDGWEWCRLGSLFQTLTGTTPPTGDASLYGGKYPFYKPPDLDSGFEVLEAAETVTEDGYKQGHTAPEDSVLVTCIGTVGKTGLIRKEGIFNQQINAILPNGIISPEYTYFSMCADYMQNQIKSNSSSATMPILNKTKFDNLLFVLPPLNMQKHIADKIKSILYTAEKIRSEQEELKRLTEQAKEKVLELAVSGKLVPQNKEDEPAEILLQRIREEKGELAKTGQIRAEKDDGEIVKTRDNCYYGSIPENWAVSTLEDLTDSKTLTNGTGFLKGHMSDHGEIKLIRPSDIGKMRFLGSDFRRVSENAFVKLGCTEIFSGYLLINRILNDGMSACVLPKANGRFVASVDVCQIAPSNNYSLDYLLCVISSPYFQKKAYENSCGAMLKRINKSRLIKIPFGLPPLEEQKRIADTVRLIFCSLDGIGDK